MKKTTLYLLVGIIALLLIAAVWLFFNNRQTKNEMQEMVEQMTFEKEQLEDEYEDLALQFDGYGRNLNNDSLADKLAQEQQRVQDLLEELRITKATNARRIAELKKELATVRAVMVEYVHQIDSLSQTNERLTKENITVKQQYQEVSERASQLEEEKVKLTEVVNRAQMLEISSFAMTPLNNRDKKTTRYSKIQKLQFDYTILKNNTAETGIKQIYLRIIRPDGEVMTKNGNTFHYENADIEYSLTKDFEYGGETMSDVLYWNVDEILQTGIYNADFFCDGNLIGSFPFAIGK
ncbi:MAG: hypothetical protein IJ776_03770 [Paludibacteraceae bacterium]|nr:hypothetical protein [Paludibacteraceae bacterium]